MSVDIRSSDRRRYMNELQAREKEIAAGLLKSSQPASPKALQENEKRMRREIANSNERRRMQCINAGFSNLRTLIPQLEGEKLSKAAILQHTTDYISAIEKEKSHLQMQLDHTKRLLSELGQDRVVTETYVANSPPPSKRKKRDTESSDEGVGSLSDASDDGGSELRHENVTLRHQLETERQRYAALEERNRHLETQLCSLLHVQSLHPSTMNSLGPVSIETHNPSPQESFYNREVVEVIGSREVPSPREDKYLLPPRPLSPTPERGNAMDTSVPMEMACRPRLLDSSPHCLPLMERESVSPVVKMESSGCRETKTPEMPQRVPSVGPMMVGQTSTHATTTSSSTDQNNYHHHHNYCHPRRRLKQQAQLEQQQAEEELRQQQEQTAADATATNIYRPKPNTQNLENLVKAIRHIEGDSILCDERKLYEEEHKMYDKRQSLPNSEESERETSSVSDQEELKSESSGRDSPYRSHHRHHHLIEQQQDLINSHQLSSSSSSPNSTMNISNSSFSEKYPIATHLLHRPVHPSFYRPGVIVHKQ